VMGEIPFIGIFDIVEKILYSENVSPVNTVEDIQDIIKETKQKTENLIKKEY